MKKKVIKKNLIKCNHCHELLESKHVHDFKTCMCGACSVDGGHDYLRRSFKTHPDIDYTDLSEYEEIEVPDEEEFPKYSLEKDMERLKEINESFKKHLEEFDKAYALYEATKSNSETSAKDFEEYLKDK